MSICDTDCHTEGINGRCGITCPVFVDGYCEQYEEGLEGLECSSHYTEEEKEEISSLYIDIELEEESMTYFKKGDRVVVIRSFTQSGVSFEKGAQGRCVVFGVTGGLGIHWDVRQTGMNNFSGALACLSGLYIHPQNLKYLELEASPSYKEQVEAHCDKWDTAGRERFGVKAARFWEDTNTNLNIRYARSRPDVPPELWPKTKESCLQSIIIPFIKDFPKRGAGSEESAIGQLSGLAGVTEETRTTKECNDFKPTEEKDIMGITKTEYVSRINGKDETEYPSDQLIKLIAETKDQQIKLEEVNKDGAKSQFIKDKINQLGQDIDFVVELLDERCEEE